MLQKGVKSVKRKLYFERSNRHLLPLGEVTDLSAAFAAIDEFLKQREYKSCYTRMWTEKSGITYFDVGSHSEFFVMYPEGEEPKDREIDEV